MQETAKLTEDGLTQKQEAFCQAYTSHDTEMFGHGTGSYLEAYGLEDEEGNKIGYMVAAASASRLLKNVKIINRINKLLETGGFNNENVDKQHLFLLNQHADLKTKLGAIKEYNLLKKRIDNKLELILPKPLLAYVLSNNSNQEDNGNEQTDKSSARGDISEQNNLNSPLLDTLIAK